MNQRCYNQKHHSYHNYGGRGITVCDEWKNDFISYYNYIINLPNFKEKGMTLDRINNDGNYEPGNMRWTTAHVQLCNQRKPKKNKSGYIGVYKRYKNKDKWVSLIQIDNRNVSLGIYDSPEEAVIVRDAYIIDRELFEYPLQVLFHPTLEISKEEIKNMVDNEIPFDEDKVIADEYNRYFFKRGIKAAIKKWAISKAVQPEVTHCTQCGYHYDSLLKECPTCKGAKPMNMPWSEIHSFIEVFHKTYGNKPWTIHSFRKALKNWLKTK